MRDVRHRQREQRQGRDGLDQHGRADDRIGARHVCAFVVGEMLRSHAGEQRIVHPLYEPHQTDHVERGGEVEKKHQK